VTLKAPWTVSSWRAYSYGGFGGGYPHFHQHADSRYPNLADLGLSARESARSGLLCDLTCGAGCPRVTRETALRQG
jgi:hypothetical protein